ncbi:MAG: AmmeMemoRadiSam system protein B [Thermoplasmata archaeon]|nr:AmmeMemoRadiSam system protein B [Thermoplasmata archaeon]
MAVRPPAVAGTFYPKDPNDLQRLVSRCFTERRGPGRLPRPASDRPRSIRAMIVPHAGYVYSGAIAAYAFRALGEERPVETVLILGVNHRGRGARAALSDMDWQTPLGVVPTDRELVAALRHGPVEVDNAVHGPEHSIEVELPWLQTVYPRPQIVALSVSFAPLASLIDVAAVVRSALRRRDALVIASTDFSHYVPPETARRLDRLALDAVRSRDPDVLYRTVVANDISMCGIAPTVVLLSALQDETLTVEELAWGHSGEAEPMRDVVGYASLLLRS